MKLIIFGLVLCGITIVAPQSPVGTRKPTTNSTTTRMRPCITCTMACDYGFVMGSDGCPKCECKPAPDKSHPCLGYTYCGAEGVCEEEKVTCFTEPCHPIPKCKQFSCPSVGYGYGGCWEACSSDSDCLGMSSEPMLCCSNGCGHTCIGREGGSMVSHSGAAFSFSFTAMTVLLPVITKLMM